MADQVMNIVKGRINELHDRVDSNDPAASGIIVVLLKVAEVDATLIDYDDLGALLAGSNTEADFTNYARKTLTDTAITASTVDDTNDRRESDAPDQVFSSAGGATDNTLVKLLMCYDDDTGAGTDANIEVMSHHDFDITTNGGDVTAQYDAAGYVRAA